MPREHGSLDEQEEAVEAVADPAWQIDDGEASMSTALHYLTVLVRERTGTIARAPRPQPIAVAEPIERRRARLEWLRRDIRHSLV